MIRNKRVAVVAEPSTCTSRGISDRGQHVVSALGRRGYRALALPADPRLDRRLRRSAAQLVFNALPQGHPVNANLQGLCELLGLRCTGSGLLASALTKDAAKVKEVLRLHNLPTPSHYTVRAPDLARLTQVHGSFGFPVRVRPGVLTLDNPRGALAADLHQLHCLCQAAVTSQQSALVERDITGVRIGVAIVHGHALGIRRMEGWQGSIPKGSIGPERRAGLLRLALGAYGALGCRGTVQVEMVVSELLNEYILAVDTCPPLNGRGVVATLARHHGIDFDDLIELMLDDARGADGGTITLSPGRPPEERRDQNATLRRPAGVTGPACGDSRTPMLLSWDPATLP